jgi:hypothetical protein
MIRRPTRLHHRWGSRGDNYDSSLAQAVNAAYKTEFIDRDKPWRNADDVELGDGRMGGPIQPGTPARSPRQPTTSQVRGRPCWHLTPRERPAPALATH